MQTISFIVSVYFTQGSQVPQRIKGILNAFAVLIKLRENKNLMLRFNYKLNIFFKKLGKRIFHSKRIGKPCWLY